MEIESSSSEPTDPIQPPTELSYFSSTLPFRPLTLRNSAILACRVLSLWILSQLLQPLGLVIALLLGWLASLKGWTDFPRSLSYLGTQVALSQGPLLLLWGAVWVLWKKAPWLADRIIGLPPISGPGSHTAAEEEPAIQEHTADIGATAAQYRSPGGDVMDGVAPLLQLALIAVGVFVLAESIPEIGRHLVRPLFDDNPSVANNWLSQVWTPSLVAVLIKSAIGLWLVLGNAGVARTLVKLRVNPRTGRSTGDSANTPDGPL